MVGDPGANCWQWAGQRGEGLNLVDHQKIKAAAKYVIRAGMKSLPKGARQYIRTASEDAPQKPDLRPWQQQIAQAVVAANSGELGAAEELLRRAGSDDPAASADVVPHLRRVQFLRARAADPQVQSETQEMQATLRSMRQEIESARIYVPSTFWDTHGRYHIELLERYGIENFKRTVSHHYQNWYMVTREDPQVQALAKSWSAHGRTQPWFNTMEVPDHVGLHLSLNFDKPVNPLAFAEQREIYRIAVGLLWELVDHADQHGILNQLTESEIGNPYRIWREGRLISSDLAHSVRERNMLLEASSLNGSEGLTVGELGAGHGRLAEIFGRTTNYRHYIFDITPALYVSQWYIKRLFPNEKIFEFRHFDHFDEIRDELQSSRFAFFTANQIEKLPDGTLDLFINMNSLMEMESEQIRNFLHQIDRLAKRAFLSRQFSHWTNALEGQTVTRESFALPERWRLAVDKPDDVHPEFFNQIWKR